ncbi:MAG: ATP-binding cassette domain-containing protein [Firmicutes bacterium]|nr:ATP-binding cassette domain-containing protein [Bacillota bacterium]
MQITLKNISKDYDGLIGAINGVDLTINNGDIFVLLGQIGSGKTTLCRLIAGLEVPSEGEIFFDGVAGDSVSIKERDICYIGDSCGLLKGKTIEKSIIYGLKLRKIPKEEISSRLKKASQMLGLCNWLKTKPSKKKPLPSEIQVKAFLARALVRKPKIIIFDDLLLGMYEQAERPRVRSIRESDMSFVGDAEDGVPQNETNKNQLLHLICSTIKSLSATTIFVTSDNFQAQLFANEFQTEYKTLTNGILQ